MAVGITSKLNRRVEVWRRAKSTTRNELNQFDYVDSKVKTIWAAVVPQTGTLLSNRPADTLLTQTTHKIICRYDPLIKKDMWLIYEGERYDILYILDPYLSHDSLEIFCRVVTD